MDDTTSRDRTTDSERIAHEQAEVAAALGRARQGRVDETAVLGDVAEETSPHPPAPLSTADVSATADLSSAGYEAPAGPWPAPVGAPVATVQHSAAPSWPAASGDHGWQEPSLGQPGWQPPAEPPAPAYPIGPGRRRRPVGWVAISGTAAAAALLASVGTAAVTGAFDEPPVPAAGVEQTQTAQAVPVSASGQQPDWQAVAAAVRESVVAIEVRTAGGQGAGSGVVLDADGHVLTNSHVVNGGQEVAVSLSDGRIYQAEIVGQDETTDLAVLALVDPPSDLVPATFGTSGELVVGEPVAAVGNPLGLDSTVTTGIISALDRPVATQSESASVVTNAIQVDAAINPGNSGGPLFNRQGEVIGINTAIATLSGGSASGSIGLGFAIPVDQASDVAAQLVADGTVEHAFLGVGLGDTTTTADGVTRQGAEVRQVEKGSPAADAGLRTGDVITAIDGRNVDGAASLTGYVRQYGTGDDVVLTVVRDGAATEVTATLAARAEPLG